MNEDVKRALEAADKVITTENKSMTVAMRAVGHAYLLTFLRAMPEALHRQKDGERLPITISEPWTPLRLAKAVEDAP